jgi:hypothetical protein
MLAGSAFTLGIIVSLLRRVPELFLATIGLGAAVWVAGNALWLLGWPIYRVVPWWAGFLVLVIAGERLELTRLFPPSAARRAGFVGALVGLVGGIVSSAFALDAGVRLAGVGTTAIACWLARYDMARRTVRQGGLSRFMAVCLLTGYAWLAVAGTLGAIFGAEVAGPRYDAVLHALFLGFVASMLFAHAPVVFPGVLGRPLAYHPRFYIHVLALHASLVARVAGDLLGVPWLRQWGGLANAAVLLLFLANTVASLGGPGTHARKRARAA